MVGSGFRIPFVGDPGKHPARFFEFGVPCPGMTLRSRWRAFQVPGELFRVNVEGAFRIVGRDYELNIPMRELELRIQYEKRIKQKPFR